MFLAAQLSSYHCWQHSGRHQNQITVLGSQGLLVPLLTTQNSGRHAKRQTVTKLCRAKEVDNRAKIGQELLNYADPSAVTDKTQSFLSWVVACLWCAKHNAADRF